MKWRGKVASLLLSKKENEEPSIFILIDPNKVTDLNDLEKRSQDMKKWNIDLFLVGGSLGVSEEDVDKVVKTLNKTDLPVVLFPGNINGISKYADAILFMSLLNSENPYYIIGAQMLGAPIIKRYGLETLPTAYIIVGEGGTVGYVGWARTVPNTLIDVAVAYAIAAEMMGMKFIYLEAGSGAKDHVNPLIIRSIKKHTKLYIIAGGGIKTSKDACTLINAGADAIVIGTIVEKQPEVAEKIVRDVKSTCSSYG